MGEMADDILEGLMCQYCGCLIDGREAGYPRSCSGCREDDEKLDYSDVVKLFKEKGFVVTSEREIKFGHQFRFESGAILNLYDSGAIQLQGKPDEKLKKLMTDK